MVMRYYERWCRDMNRQIVREIINCEERTQPTFQMQSRKTEDNQMMWKKKSNGDEKKNKKLTESKDLDILCVLFVDLFHSITWELETREFNSNSEPFNQWWLSLCRCGVVPLSKVHSHQHLSDVRSK